MGVENTHQCGKKYASSTLPECKRRPMTTLDSNTKPVFIVLTNESENHEGIVLSSKKAKKSSPRKEKDDEKRLKLFRKKAPLSYYERLRRAQEQR